MRKGDPQDHSHRVYKPEPVPQRTRGVPDGAGLLSASGSRDSLGHKRVAFHHLKRHSHGRKTSVI